MALADYDLPKRAVPLPGGNSFAVRGFSLEDITLLIDEQGEAVQKFFDEYSKDGQFRSDASPIAAIMDVLKQAPDLAASIIARAADEPGTEPKIKKLPIGVQLDAIQKVADLTFEASGGPGNFVETVVSLMRGLGSAASSKSASILGSKASGVK